MENYRHIQIMDAMRNRLLGELPALEEYTSSIRRTDYRTATPGEMQIALAEVLFDLDRRNAGQARAIHIKITEAEHVMATAAAPARLPRWLINEPAISHPQAQVPLTPAQAQSLRYLALPAMPAPGDATPTLSRFGQDLAACITLARALQLLRQRLPALKGLLPYRFLMAIGYPAAVPTPHALRLARYLGIVHLENSTAPAEYITALQEIAHQSSNSIAALDALFQLYANPAPASQEKWDPVCRPRKPRCSVCTLTAWCSNYALAVEAEGETHETAPTEPRRLSVKEWAPDERPRERMLAGERLSNSELLAIILRTGTGSQSAVELAREVLNTFGTLHDLEKATPQEIADRMRGRGIGPAKAVEICAALELGRRVSQPAADTRLGLPHVSSSKDIFQMCRTRYKAATQEEFLLLVLNTKNRVQKMVPVSVGTLNASIVHPRDVFRHALKEAAAAVIFVHNHPSGDPQPSDEDILLTARLVDAGKLLGIQVLDHVIIGSHEWYSFSDHGRLK